MKRLCIYVTYNKANKIDAYIGYMLKALRELITTLYVVCNYPKIVDGEEYVELHADEVFYRENKGYDAGAYKDMLCTMLGWDVVYQYDELILVNDSFLGPFWDLPGYFALMEDNRCDFWGMTRQFAGKLESAGYKYKPHVHSYFLVFRNEVLKSVSFKNFWEIFDYPKTFTEAVINFEIKINEYLEQNGFLSMAVTDVKGMTFKEDEIAFLMYPYELVRDRVFPFLKKKSLLIRNKGFASVLKAIEFIEAHHLYPVNWIWELIDSQFYIENYAPEKANCLEQFCNKFSKIYIYGAGVCGKNLILYFEKKGWKQDGILVSDKTGQDMECTAFKEAVIDDETGIIVSVIHQESSEEIVKYIETKSKCKREQIFIVYDCKAIRIPE